MFAPDCIDPSIKALQIQQTVSDAMEWCQTHQTSQAIIADGEKWMGILNEEILFDLDDFRKLAELEDLLQPYHLTEYTHVFDVLKTSNLHRTFVLPVINSEKELMGITSAASILQAWSKDSHFTGPGGIMILELQPKDYSLSEIAKIAESNGASIIHSMISSSPNTDKMRVSLKISKNDLKDIQQTFERYNYEVVAVIHQSEYELELQDRLDSLMRYLEV